jgi:hypothetical protein
MEPVTWLSTTLFYVLGAYVGVVSALFLGGLELARTVFVGIWKTPAAFVEALLSLPAPAMAAPTVRPSRAEQHPRLRKKLFEGPEEVGAPAGVASYGGYGVLG